MLHHFCCFVSQRYWKMKSSKGKARRFGVAKAIHNGGNRKLWGDELFCIPKILKNESNSQPRIRCRRNCNRCFVSQRYWKMKAIHNITLVFPFTIEVVLYPKDTEKWKQFTTEPVTSLTQIELFCIPKILKNESNSQLNPANWDFSMSCFVSQRYWKMKAIHNRPTL